MENETSGEQFVEAAAPVEAEVQQQQPEAAPEMVPLSALQAERRERQQMQEQMKMLQDHVSLMQANQQPAQQPQNEYEGMSDDDVLTVGEAKRFMQQYKQETSTAVEELRVLQKYNDYNEVIREYLPQVIKDNPALKATLQNDPNRYELAYYLAKNSDQYRNRDQGQKANEQAERLLKNAKTPVSLSAVGGNAPTQQPSAYKNMSDAEFLKLANRHRGVL